MIRCLPVGRILPRVDSNLRRNVNVARLTCISLVVAIQSIELTYEIIKINALIEKEILACIQKEILDEIRSNNRKFSSPQRSHASELVAEMQLCNYISIFNTFDFDN